MAETYEQRLLRLVGMVYDSALDPTRWAKTIEAIKEAVGGEASAIFHHDGALASLTGRPIELVATTGYDDTAKSDYQHFAAMDTRALLVRSRPQGGTYVDDRDYGFDAFTRTEIFNDFFKPINLGHGIAINLFADATRQSLLSVHRHLQAGAFDEQSIRLFEDLGPHVTRAMQLTRQSVILQMAKDGAASVSDALAAAIILVDSGAHVLWANPSAERLLLQGVGLTVRQGRLVAQQSSQNNLLYGLIAKAVETAAGKGEGTGEALAVTRGDGRAPLSVLVCPLRPSDPCFRLLTPGAVILIKDQENVQPTPSQAIARHYGLTKAESELLAALIGGARIADYAEARGISKETVKTHLRRLFEKTGTNRQSDLLRTVLINPALNITDG